MNMPKKARKKTWKIKPLSGGKKFAFTPYFEVNEADKTVETRYIDITVDGKTHRFNYLDLYMFFYFTANEELRRGLALRETKNVGRIPYEVSFKLSPKEQSEAFVSRRIELRVDQLTMAIARERANDLIRHHVKKNTLDRLAKGR